MTVTLLQHLSGAKTYTIGEEIEVSDLEALRMIAKGIAKAKNQKAHNDLVTKVEKLEKEASEKETKIIAIAKEDELRREADDLLDNLLAIVSTLETMNPNYKEEFISQFHAKFLGETEQ